MFYYIDTIEQVKAAEDYPWTVNEYGARTKYTTTIDEVRSKYYEKLSNVANDLVTIDPNTKSHYYMDIKIVNSDGGIEEKAKLGTRQEVEKRTQNQTPTVEG